jgi:nucleoid-associated protein YgaU
MGLINFIRGAGRKEEEEQDERVREAVMSNKLRRYVLGLGFEVDKLVVKFDDGVATATGTAKSQGDREKIVLALGNTQGVAQVDDQMQTLAPEPEGTFYTVEKGDSLSKIAKDSYGDYKKYTLIFEANKPMLGDPDKIYPGQVLRIPPLG